MLNSLTLPHDSLGATSPFEVVHGYAPRTSWALATKYLQQAQKMMADKTNVHRREIDFQVGDEKLDFPTNGKFKIIEKVGNAFRIQLPSSMAINNTYPPDKLRKAANDLLPGQEQPASFPININGYDEHEIDEILACKLTNRILSYRVAWLNEDADLNWYPASELIYAPFKLHEFHL
ncbi:hypothetical protein K3495_g10045 [Podosphaera aphanis]|nr:hypothetical protein K3495_g10045 [Podosphaera aphanis]